MTLLNYVWRAASPLELAITRAAIDERAAPLVAAAVRDEPQSRVPRTLEDINFLVHERSMNRTGDPETFLRADLAFHRAIVASLRSIEIGPALYGRVCDRLRPELMPVADVQAGDGPLDAAHLRLAAAVLGGDVRGAARCARHVAHRELRSLEKALG
jgi:DNA-binding FadR family transcriptional regulator